MANKKWGPVVEVACICNGKGGPSCPGCEGFGVVEKKSCMACGGTGKEGGVAGKCNHCRGQGWRDDDPHPSSQNVVFR